MAADSEDWAELRRRLLEFERADVALRLTARRLAPRDKERIKALQDALQHGPASWAPRRMSRLEEEAVAAHRVASECLIRVRAWLAARGEVVVPRELGLRKSNPLLATALAKIRGNEEAYVTAVGHFGIGGDSALEGLPEEARFDEWFQTLAFNHTSDCAERWLKAGALLVSSPLPDHVVNALQSLRQVYSLGHPEATLAFVGLSPRLQRINGSLRTGTFHVLSPTGPATPIACGNSGLISSPFSQKSRVFDGGPMRSSTQIARAAQRMNNRLTLACARRSGLLNVSIRPSSDDVEGL